MTDYLKKLCKDDDAKGTLKVAIFKDYWQKLVDVEIDDHNLRIQQLLRWVDMLPGYLAVKLTTKERNRNYVATFPKAWGRKFNEVKDINSTTFDNVDKFMEQQKETANKEHATKERKNKKDKEDKKKAHCRGNGNSSSKYKINRTATCGPTSKCKKHPNANMHGAIIF